MPLAASPLKPPTLAADLLTRDECCAFLRIRATKLWQLDRDGLLRPSFRLGRRVLYRRLDVEKFLERLHRQQHAKTAAR